METPDIELLYKIIWESVNMFACACIHKRLTTIIATGAHIRKRSGRCLHTTGCNSIRIISMVIRRYAKWWQYQFPWHVRMNNAPSAREVTRISRIFHREYPRHRHWKRWQFPPRERGTREIQARRMRGSVKNAVWESANPWIRRKLCRSKILVFGNVKIYKSADTNE